MRAHHRVHLSLIPLATLVSPLLCQLKFNGAVSSSSNSNSPSNNNNNRPTDVDEKFFFGGDTPSLTGNQALDGGIVGLGLGALGAAVLGPTIQGALNGGQQQSQGYSCGRRRKRQANFGGSQTSGGGKGQEIDGEERFFLPTGQGCTCNTNGRRRRQAPGEDEPGTRFFGGLFGGQQQHCGSCCYNSQPFNNNGFNSNFQNQGFNNQNQGFNNQNQGFNSQNQGFNNQNNGRCQCDYSLTFRDQNGNTHGACQRRDNTGRTWCYTTGRNNNCGDLQNSKRFPNNPWSYNACSNQG